MNKKEYWVITLLFIRNSCSSSSTDFKYRTLYFEKFPSNEDLLDEYGEEGNILFMKELTEEQYERLSGIK